MWLKARDVITSDEEKRLREAVLSKFREKSYDAGLDAAVRLVRSWRNRSRSICRVSNSLANFARIPTVAAHPAADYARIGSQFRIADLDTSLPAQEM